MPVNPNLVPSDPSGIRGPYTNSNRIYMLNYQTLNDLIKVIVSPTFVQSLSGIFDDPIDNVGSVHLYPLHLPGVVTGNSPDEEIKIGGVSTGITANVLDGVPSMFGTEYLTIPKKYNSFLDYAPYTQIRCHIPFVGDVEVDPAQVMGHKVAVNYSFDFTDGSCTAYINVFQGDRYTTIASYNGRLGVSIPLSGRNNTEIARNNLAAGLGAVASVGGSIAATVASGGAMGWAIPAAVAGATASTINANVTKDITLSTASAGFNSFYGPLQVFFEIKRPNPVTTTYASTIGRPLMDTVKLGDMTGYVKVGEIHVIGMGTATAEERQEVEDLLKEGVIF